MDGELDKTIIRIVQDHCVQNGASKLCLELALSMTTSLVHIYKHGTLSPKAVEKLIRKYRNFGIANEIDINHFARELYDKLRHELSFYSVETIYDTIMKCKCKFEATLTQIYSNSTDENTLRTIFAALITTETLLEPEISGGKCDIYIPSEKVVIETKLWKGVEYYNSGYPELEAYLKGFNCIEGYYVVFDFNHSDNAIIKENGRIFDVKYSGKMIHVIFVKMNPTQPSKIYKEQKVLTKKPQK